MNIPFAVGVDYERNIHQKGDPEVDLQMLEGMEYDISEFDQTHTVRI